VRANGTAHPTSGSRRQRNCSTRPMARFTGVRPRLDLDDRFRHSLRDRDQNTGRLQPRRTGALAPPPPPSDKCRILGIRFLHLARGRGIEGEVYRAGGLFPGMQGRRADAPFYLAAEDAVKPEGACAWMCSIPRFHRLQIRRQETVSWSARPTACRLPKCSSSDQ